MSSRSGEAGVLRTKLYPYTLLYFTTTTTPFTVLFSTTTWVSWQQKGETSMYLNDARDDGVLGQWHQLDHAPHARQITTPTPHHSIFYRPDALPDA